jgi:type IV pilus assembly protein PilW
MKHERTNLRRASERGYSLTEVMVAITLSVFLLMGLFSILQQTRKTSSTTTGLSQLQDDERVAMTIITDTIQAAGYVPEANGSGESQFVVDTGGGFATQGQIITARAYSTSNGVATGDRLTMRYVLGTNDTTLQCDGELNTGAETVFKEIFEIDVATGTGPNAGTYQLVCVPHDGAAGVPIVNNVVSLTFQFNVNSTAATSSTPSNQVGPTTLSSTTGSGCPGDSWVSTANMQTNDWTNVCAVKVDLVFINPLYKPPGQPQPTPGQNQYITFERVIGLLNKAGVNVTNSTQT